MRKMKKNLEPKISGDKKKKKEEEEEEKSKQRKSQKDR